MVSKLHHNHRFVARRGRGAPLVASQLAALHKRVFVEQAIVYRFFGLDTIREANEPSAEVPRVHSMRRWHLPSARPTSSKQLHCLESVVERFQSSMPDAEHCSIASLEAYAKQVEKLTTQWPRCWGLIYLAHDSGRAERLERIRRKLTI